MVPDVSQGKVVTHLSCDGIFSDDFITKFTDESDGKRICKIGRHLAMLQARLEWQLAFLLLICDLQNAKVILFSAKYKQFNSLCAILCQKSQEIM